MCKGNDISLFPRSGAKLVKVYFNPVAQICAFRGNWDKNGVKLSSVS